MPNRLTSLVYIPNYSIFQLIYIIVSVATAELLSHTCRARPELAGTAKDSDEGEGGQDEDAVALALDGTKTRQNGQGWASLA